jgi:hypothetical protein
LEPGAVLLRLVGLRRTLADTGFIHLQALELSASPKADRWKPWLWLAAVLAELGEEEAEVEAAFPSEHLFRLILEVIQSLLEPEVHGQAVFLAGTEATHLLKRFQLEQAAAVVEPTIPQDLPVGAAAVVEELLEVPHRLWPEEQHLRASRGEIGPEVAMILEPEVVEWGRHHQTLRHRQAIRLDLEKITARQAHQFFTLVVVAEEALRLGFLEPVEPAEVETGPQLAPGTTGQQTLAAVVVADQPGCWMVGMAVLVSSLSAIF